MNLGVVSLLNEVDVTQMQDTSSDLKQRLLILVWDATHSHGILKRKGKERKGKERKPVRERNRNDRKGNFRLGGYPGLLIVHGIILTISIVGSTLVQEEEILWAGETEPFLLLLAATLGHLVVDVEVPLSTLLIAHT